MDYCFSPVADAQRQLDVTPRCRDRPASPQEFKFPHLLPQCNWRPTSGEPADTRGAVSTAGPGTNFVSLPYPLRPTISVHEMLLAIC